MRAAVEPGAWSEAERAAFCSQPTLPLALAAVEAVRATAEAAGHTAETYRAWHAAEHRPESLAEDALAWVGLLVFLVGSIGAGYGAFLALRALWRWGF
jgi:hypothetical protein